MRQNIFVIQFKDEIPYGWYRADCYDSPQEIFDFIDYCIKLDSNYRINNNTYKIMSYIPEELLQ